MNQRFQSLYMDIARRTAQMSRAIRLQVGCIIVKNDRIISMSWNGTPAGWPNDCEDKEWFTGGGWIDPTELEASWPYQGTYQDQQGNAIEGRYRLVTKPECLHAESNAVAKLAKSNESGLNADLFVTHAPCMQCAKLIFQSGISRVYFSTAYRDDSGVKFLEASGVQVEQLHV